MSIEEYISGETPLPKLGTVERRQVRLALLDERDKITQVIENLIIDENKLPEDPEVAELDKRLRAVNTALCNY